MFITQPLTKNSHFVTFITGLWEETVIHTCNKSALRWAAT